MERMSYNIILKSLFDIAKPNFNHRYPTDIVNEILKYISSIDYHLHDTIEIEAKLGRFEFKGGAVIAFSKIQEAFLIPEFSNKSREFSSEFIAGLLPNQFYLIWNAMEYEASIPNSGIKSLGALTYQDTFYKSGKRRSLIYCDGKEIGEEIIRKESKRHFNVRNCSNDFRITCSKEMMTDISEDDVEEMQRTKMRTSYEFSFYRVDFSITTSSKTDIICYEIELEINQLKSLLGQTIDYESLRKVLERFIQNVIFLYSAASMEGLMLAMEREKKANSGSNSNNGLSLFGNYLENNMPKGSLP